MLEVLPQEQVQRRTVEQIVDPVPVVPMLHMFVPQMVAQLVDILAALDLPVPEQVFEVPKIVCPALRIFEQTVDIPGRAGGRGVTGGRKVSLFAAEQIVDTPVPHRGSSGSLQGLLPRTEFNCVGGGRQDPGVPSAASSSGLPDTANQGGLLGKSARIRG